MKHALLTVNINDVLHDNSRQSFIAAAERWGAEYVEVTSPTPGASPWETKLHAFELTMADRVFYVDADTVISASCPNPFDAFPAIAFVAVNNQQAHMPAVSYRACMDTFERDMRAIAMARGAELFAKRFVNSGVWLASRAVHTELLEEAAGISRELFGVTAWRDQSALNYCLLKRNVVVVIAPDTWNYQFPPDTEARPMAQFVYHWAGNENRERIPHVNWQAKPDGYVSLVTAEAKAAVKPRLLLVADHCVPTGFARVAENISRRLHREWELHVVALNYKGDPHEFPYKVYPAINGGDIWGLGKTNRLVGELRPDAILLINDPWIVSNPGSDREFLMLERGDTPMAAYMPVDAKNIPEHVSAGLNRLDLAIFYTDFARTQVELGGYQGPSKVIPHGVNTELYRPIDRAEARASRGLAGHIPEDSFIVGNVNRNQPRKRLDLAVAYFAEWVHRYLLPPNVYLYIHCAQRDSGWDLCQLGHYYGVDRRLILPSAEVVTPERGLDEDEMPYVYSAFDVQLTTTTGEGWGLTNHEGMACGIPQIVPQYSGLGEWAAGAALMVPCTGMVAHIGINTIGGIPDQLETVNALHRMYRDADLRRDYAERALVRARESRFQWEKIADLFQCHLGQMLIDSVAKARERKLQAQQQQQKEIEGEAAKHDGSTVAA